MLNLLNAKDQTQVRKTRLDFINSTHEQANLVKEYRDAKAKINADYEFDDPRREIALDMCKDEFDFLKAEAADYTSQAQQKLDDLNTRIDQRKTLISTTKDEIKEEVKEDHSYGLK
jgi:hypothetical protein